MSSSSGRLLVLVACVILTAVCLAAAEDEPSSQAADAEQIATWIEQLGHVDYDKREQAMERLLEAGPAALARVREAAEATADDEVRARCNELIAHYESLSSARAIDALAAGKLDPDEVAFPGWQRLRSRMPNNADGRRLFASMLRARSDLLKMADRNPDAARYALNADWAATYRVSVHGEVEDGAIATLLFLAGERDVNRDGRCSVHLDYTCRGLLAKSKGRYFADRPLMQRLLADYVARTDVPRSASRRMKLGLVANLHGPTRALALHSLRDRKQTGTTRALSLRCLAIVGTRKDVATIERLLEDSGVVTRLIVGKDSHEIQMRDLALIALIRITKQQVDAYGLREWSSRASGSRFYFDTDEQRQAAIRKWAVHREAMREAEREEKEDKESASAAGEASDGGDPSDSDVDGEPAAEDDK